MFRKMYYVLLVLVKCLLISNAENITRPTVQLSFGSVKGWRMESNVSNGTYMNVFRGIPYAQPPIGSLRFKAPEPVQNFIEEKDLSQANWPPCPQRIGGYGATTNYSEDCLILNIYAPEMAKSGDILPVMFWIHGGALSSGSSSMFAPDFLVEKNIIFVSINYRVGALGFLNLETDDVPGNAGLKDQNLALQWVKREISNFGGDPAKVTIFGESAGSTCVSFHYISPRSQGLFSKAICESGNAFSETTFLETGYLDRATALSNKLNCTDKSGSVNLTCMQNVNVDDIVTYQDLSLSDEYTTPGNNIVFTATPEKMSNTAILTDTPQNILNNLIKSNYTRIPLIMGINHDEGTVNVQGNSSFYLELPSKLQYFIPTAIRLKKSSDEIKLNVASIYKYYFNNTVPSLSNLDGYIKIYGDKMFGVCTSVFARKLINFNQIYLYHFDFIGNFTQNGYPGMNIANKVGHGDELNYLFYTQSLNQTAIPENSTTKITLRRMVKMWTDFATFGNPTLDATNDTVLNGFKWTPISKDSISYMRVTQDLKMISENFLEDEVTFWNNIDTIDSIGSKLSISIVCLICSLVFILKI